MIHMKCQYLFSCEKMKKKKKKIRMSSARILLGSLRVNFSTELKVLEGVEVFCSLKKGQDFLQCY